MLIWTEQKKPLCAAELVLISAKALCDSQSQGIFKLFTIKKRSIPLVDVLVLEYPFSRNIGHGEIYQTLG